MADLTDFTPEEIEAYEFAKATMYRFRNGEISHAEFKKALSSHSELQRNMNMIALSDFLEETVGIKRGGDNV